MSKALLITSAAEKGAGIGTLYLRSLIEAVPGISVYWRTEQPFLLGQSVARFGKLGALLRSTIVRLPLWSAMRLRVFNRLILPFKIKLVERLLQQHKSNTILLTASSPELIALGAKLAGRGHDVLVIVWDAPEYLAKNLLLNHAGSNTLKNDFAALMLNARAAGVISEAMRDSYSKSYGVRCEIIRHGTAPQLRPVIAVKPEIIKIVFAGSLYSKEEWNSFIQALNMADWKIDNKPVKLFFIGKFPLAGVERPKIIQFIETVPHAQALSLMSEMDMGYLPYWFAPEHEIVTRTSFPGKMTAYAAAGLAVFHHGPSYSTVTNFLERYPFGISCNSLDPIVIIKKLEELSAISNSNSVKQARTSALQQELSAQAMVDGVNRLFALSPRNQSSMATATALLKDSVQ